MRELNDLRRKCLKVSNHYDKMILSAKDENEMNRLIAKKKAKIEEICDICLGIIQEKHDMSREAAEELVVGAIRDIVPCYQINRGD